MDVGLSQIIILATTGHLNQASVDCHSESPKERVGLDRNLKKFSWLPAVTISQVSTVMS